MKQCLNDFIKHVLHRSNKVDDCVLGYINLNKEFILTSLKTELDKQQFKTARYSISKSFEKLSNIDEKDIWYNYHKSHNINGYMNKLNNYGVKLNYYDLTESKDKTITSTIKKTRKTFKSKDAINSFVQLYNFGIENNVYTSYHEAYIRNDFYLKDFFSYNVFLNVNSQTIINIFDKVELIVPSLPIYDAGSVNELIGGTYLVAGIIHHISKGGIYKKEISLHRNGFNESNHQTSYTSQ